jgi:drug/metabolite transporter (DMT)-like permease
MPAGRYTGRDALNFFLLGLFGVTMNQVLFTLGLNYTTVAHSALIIGTGPITTLLLASLIRLESLTARKLLGMVLSFAGVGVLAAEHGLSLGSGTLRGDLITLGGSLGFALYTVTAKRVARGYDTVTMNTFNYLAGGLLILPLAVRQAARLDWAAVPWTGWASLFYMAMCASVLAYLIYYWALKHMAASRLVAFGYLTPLLGTLLGIVLLDEPATVHLAAGGALIVTGVYITESRPRRAAGEAEEEENDA